MPNQKQFRLPKEIPLEEYPKPEIFLEEANHLIEDAQKEGIILRVMGPIALHFYFPQYVDLYRKMGRLEERVFTDIDFAAYGKQRGRLPIFFKKEEYEIEKRALMLSGNERHIYFGGRVPMVDVFFDRLNYNHPVNFVGRLEIDPRCISLTDLFLQKVQIVQINDKDLKDAILLLLAAKVGESEEGVINLKYLLQIFSDDWGFYYTATENLKKIINYVAGVNALTEEQKDFVRQQATYLLETIENSPKTNRWKKRAQVGVRKLWYNEVTDWL